MSPRLTRLIPILHVPRDRARRRRRPGAIACASPAVNVYLRAVGHVAHRARTLTTNQDANRHRTYHQQLGIEVHATQSTEQCQCDRGREYLEKFGKEWSLNKRYVGG